ncbi:MAG TPA: prolipoprotein diacylglyceryl transferase family protein [Candidatus Sulfomarinibacteraceae bacterium]|nr:prolipoprotein diacylglyceryl transferase family protein [Candidatus Sulfomarinibacteraceae bacterium]
MLPTINIGPLVLPTAGLVYILGIWIALSVVEKAAATLRLHVAATYTVSVTALAAGFIAARVVFVATHWSAYAENLLGIIWPLTSGFNFSAGLLAGVAGGFFYARARQLPAGATLDALAPGILVGLAVVSLADFLAGPGYGKEADLLWSVDLFGIQRHPVQVYEMLVAGLALLGWHLYRSRREYQGQLFLLATAIYSAGRFFVDTFRANAWLTDGGYHVLQIVLLLIFMGCLMLLGHLARQQASAQTEAGTASEG